MVRGRRGGHEGTITRRRAQHTRRSANVLCLLLTHTGMDAHTSAAATAVSPGAPPAATLVQPLAVVKHLFEQAAARAATTAAPATTSGAIDPLRARPTRGPVIPQGDWGVPDAFRSALGNGSAIEHVSVPM